MCLRSSYQLSRSRDYRSCFLTHRETRMLMKSCPWFFSIALEALLLHLLACRPAWLRCVEKTIPLLFYSIDTSQIRRLGRFLVTTFGAPARSLIYYWTTNIQRLDTLAEIRIRQQTVTESVGLLSAWPSAGRSRL